MSFTQDLRTQRRNYDDGETRIGEKDRIWYDPNTNTMRVSDGETPGGVIIGGFTTGGGSYSLPTATSTIKGGVKIDGATIAINNQVISVVNGVFTTGSYSDPSWITGLAYSKLTGAPPVPTNNNQLTNGAEYITSSALSGLATETYVTNRGYITSSALTGYALTSQIPAAYTLPVASASVLGGIKLGTGLSIDANGVVNVTVQGGGGGTTDLTGYATETYVTTRGYLTAVDYSIITNKPNLFSGSYSDLTNKPSLFSGSYADLTNKPTIPSITGLATETFVTSQGYLTSVGTISYNDLTNKPTIPSAYTLPTASASVLGGIKIGTGLSIDDNGVVSASSSSGNYNDLTNKPTALSQFANDRGFVTMDDVYAAILELAG